MKPTLLEEELWKGPVNRYTVRSMQGNQYSRDVINTRYFIILRGFDDDKRYPEIFNDQ